MSKIFQGRSSPRWYTKCIQNRKGLSSDDFIEYLEDEFDQEDSKMFMDMRIPDKILESFDSTHRFDKLLLEVTKGDTPLSNGRRISAFYSYCSAKWRATMYTHYHKSKDETYVKQLNIKLCHNGFRYHKREYAEHNITTHKRKFWFSLSDSILREMPFLKKLKEDIIRADRVTFFYNIIHERMDIHFFKDGQEDTSCLLITFEKGYSESSPYDYSF
jgi:hypothetical protein